MAAARGVSGRIAAAALVALLSLPAAAQERSAAPANDAHCMLVAPLVISAWIGALTDLAGPDRRMVGDAFKRIERFTNVYRTYGCAMPPLIAAVECLANNAMTTGVVGESTAGVAQTCMTQAGLPTR